MTGEPEVAGATDSALLFPESWSVQRQRLDDLFLSSWQVTAGSKRLLGVTQAGLARSLVHVRLCLLACASSSDCGLRSRASVCFCFVFVCLLNWPFFGYKIDTLIDTLICLIYIIHEYPFSNTVFSSNDVHSTFYLLVFGAVDYWLPDRITRDKYLSHCNLREATWAGARSGGTWPLSPGHVTWPGYYPGCWFCTLCNHKLRGEAALLKCQEWRPGYLYRPGEL